MGKPQRLLLVDPKRLSLSDYLDSYPLEALETLLYVGARVGGHEPVRRLLRVAFSVEGYYARFPVRGWKLPADLGDPLASVISRFTAKNAAGFGVRVHAPRSATMPSCLDVQGVGEHPVRMCERSRAVLMLSILADRRAGEPGLTRASRRARARTRPGRAARRPRFFSRCARSGAPAASSRSKAADRA